jgi:hypothetical protein
MNPPANRQPLLFGHYRLDIVYGHMTAELSGEVITLWLNNQVVPRREAQRRTAEVVMTIRDSSNVLVGVNTVYIQDFIKANNPYYFYRVFIRPEDRRSFGLRSFVSKATREFLRNYYPVGHEKPHGVVIVVENRKLARPGAQKLLARQGWTLIGKGPRGYDVWIENFDSARADTSAKNEYR